MSAGSHTDRPYALFDSLTIPAGISVSGLHPMFDEPLGSPISGDATGKRKGRTATNLYLRNCFDSPRAQIVNRIFFLFGSGSTRDQQAFQSLCRFRLEVYAFEDVFYDAPFVVGGPGDSSSVFIEAEGVNADKAGADHRTFTWERRGVFPDHAIAIDPAVVILSGQPFWFTLKLDDWFTPQADFTVYAFLDGEGRFPVQ